MTDTRETTGATTFSAQQTKEICRQAGTDDVGLVDLDRDALQKKREGALSVYPFARGVISIMVAHNRENLQSPARYVANEEYHHAGDRISGVAREILRRLNGLGIRGVVVNKGWPMALDKLPGKIWDVSHKVMAVEAGLGHMGLNRLVLHPRFGSCVVLDSILVDGLFDAYDHPLSESPCIKCNLCEAVCPTGAITKGQPFDFLACFIHTYRDNYIGFRDWVEAMVTSRDMAGYRDRFDDRDTALLWQSPMFRMTYRCRYRMAVRPAGLEPEARYQRDKKLHAEKILKPLKDRTEPVYVVAGSRAEQKANSNPNKETRLVPGVVRTPPADAG